MRSHSRRQNIILSGFMGTGKSSVGRQLAAVLGYDFVDLDSLIEAEAGISITRIFATQGEGRFRGLETRMVERLSERTGCVIATGGGAILNPRNLAALKRHGILITLTAAPETILARLGGGDDRPMLWGPDRRARVLELLAERAPAYANADLTVDTTTRTVDEVVGHLRNLLAAHGIAAG
jgi:shikimate kinase